MKTLKFRKELIEKIMSGEKSTTWRLFDDKNIIKGDEIEIIGWENKNAVAKILIEKVIEKKFNQLTEKDLEGHERYSSEEEMYKRFSLFYNQEVTPETKLKIIKFRLLK